MGAMCDPVFYVIVTCPDCGKQEVFKDERIKILDEAATWYVNHLVGHIRTEDEDG